MAFDLLHKSKSDFYQPFIEMRSFWFRKAFARVFYTMRFSIYAFIYLFSETIDLFVALLNHDLFKHGFYAGTLLMTDPGAFTAYF